MRITICVFADKTNGFKNVVNLLIYQLLVGHTVDDKTLGNDLTNRHTGVKRRDRILEYHLNLCNQLALLRNTAFLLILFFKCLNSIMIVFCGAELFIIFCMKRLNAGR